MVSEKKVKTVLSLPWIEFNKRLTKCTEEELYEMLNIECVDGRRLSYVTRIHTRYNTLRKKREFKNLMVTLN